jgi:hypothetical protein
MAVVEGSLENMVKVPFRRFLFFRHSWKGLKKLGGFLQQLYREGKAQFSLKGV